MFTHTRIIPLSSYQGFHFSGDTKFHVFFRLFPGKSNKIKSQFGFDSVCFDKIDMTKILLNDKFFFQVWS